MKKRIGLLLCTLLVTGTVLSTGLTVKATTENLAVPNVEEREPEAEVVLEEDPTVFPERDETSVLEEQVEGAVSEPTVQRPMEATTQVNEDLPKETERSETGALPQTENDIVGRTFSEWFPDPELAQYIVSSYAYGYSVTDIVTQDIYDSVVVSVSSLSFSNSSVENLEGIQYLTNLTALNLQNLPSVTSLPESLGNLTKLVQISFSDLPSLTSLPESLGNLTNLAQISFSDLTSLTSFPESFGNLTNLDWLHLYNLPSLTSLPESLGNLTKLDRLHLFTLPSVTSLPESLGNLTNLSWLHLQNFPSLTSLPESLGNLTNLNQLHVYSVPLTNLPQSFRQLKSIYRDFQGTLLGEENTNTMENLHIWRSNFIQLKEPQTYTIETKEALEDLQSQASLHGLLNPISYFSSMSGMEEEWDLPKGHTLILDELLDLEGNAVEWSDYIVGDRIVQSGSVRAKVAIQEPGTPFFTTYNANIRTEEMITLDFVQTVVEVPIDVNPLTDQDTVIVGKSEPGAGIEVTLPNGEKVTGLADDEGHFSLTIPKQEAGAELIVVATDRFGMTGTTSVLVSAVPIVAPVDPAEPAPPVLPSEPVAPIAPGGPSTPGVSAPSIPSVPGVPTPPTVAVVLNVPAPGVSDKKESPTGTLPQTGEKHPLTLVGLYLLLLAVMLRYVGKKRPKEGLYK